MSDFVQQVARYDPWPTHTRNEIKCGDFCVCFFKQHIINRQERYSFRATSCTLRSTINPRMERNKVRWFLREFFQTTHYQPSRALFISNVACILMHERFNPDTRFTDFLVTCILMHERFNLGACLMISCNKLHATIYDFVQRVTRYGDYSWYKFCILTLISPPQSRGYIWSVTSRWNDEYGQSLTAVT